MRPQILIPFVLLVFACSRGEPSPAPEHSAQDFSPDYDPSVLSVPFAVDDHYVPSGCMGDCSTSVTIDNDCPERGARAAQGECHHFVYLADAAAEQGWAGLLWQTDEHNWGSSNGRTVTPGARQVRFWARVAADGAATGDSPLTILVGAMDAADGGEPCSMDTECASARCVGGACKAPFHDTLNVTADESLGTEWQEFRIPFENKSYGGTVLSGFGWSLTMPVSARRIEFYLDDIRWE
ncbi:MAG: hypothetical protein ABJB12_07865 [Pseudomonadota bacterium]